jgi:hypothetical protein
MTRCRDPKGRGRGSGCRRSALGDGGFKPVAGAGNGGAASGDARLCAMASLQSPAQAMVGRRGAMCGS